MRAIDLKIDALSAFRAAPASFAATRISRAERFGRPLFPQRKTARQTMSAAETRPTVIAITVSYKHLTLPTILLV